MCRVLPAEISLEYVIEVVHGRVISADSTAGDIEEALGCVLAEVGEDTDGLVVDAPVVARILPEMRARRVDDTIHALHHGLKRRGNLQVCRGAASQVHVASKKHDEVKSRG